MGLAALSSSGDTLPVPSLPNHVFRNLGGGNKGGFGGNGLAGIPSSGNTLLIPSFSDHSFRNLGGGIRGGEVFAGIPSSGGDTLPFPSLLNHRFCNLGVGNEGGFCGNSTLSTSSELRVCLAFRGIDIFTQDSCVSVLEADVDAIDGHREIV